MTSEEFMGLALALGREAMGTTWPNPAVGCVIVKDGHIVGRGATASGGRPHAECMALEQAGPAAAGADVYVTLEPCAHHGRTPPCAEALIEASVARVYAAIPDTDARVDGRGFAMLRDAGIEVHVGLCADQARRDLSGFLRVAQGGLPWVTLKLASSFDGRIATASGESQWITGAPARAYNQTLRAHHDAVLIGGGTARADDPKLTLRGFEGRRSPVRVVMSAGLDLSLDSYLARTARDVPLWLIHNQRASDELKRAWADTGAVLHEIAGYEQVEVQPALRVMADAGITRIFCEGGGLLAGSLLQSGAVDEVITFIAGTALGGDARPSIGPMQLRKLAHARRFALRDFQRIGGDAMLIWEPSINGRYDNKY